MDRRKFIADIGRYSLTGGLLGTSALLLYRRRFGDPDNCFVNPFCRSCGKNTSCEVVADANIKDQKNEKQKR
ncbi:MAG: hypothetical protein OEX02_19290 [Cyclobacteriaceae bacterium]|nr:hypothetical protein [Cyclobacteriaceae bacterium]